MCMSTTDSLSTHIYDYNEFVTHSLWTVVKHEMTVTNIFFTSLTLPEVKMTNHSD